MTAASMESSKQLPRRPSEHDDEINALPRSYVSPAMRRSIQSHIRNHRKLLEERLRRLVSKALKGDSSIDLKAEALTLMTSIFTEMFRIGFTAAGVGAWDIEDWQKDMIVKLAEAEATYFREFIRQVKKAAGGQEAMGVNQRLGLYGRSADAAFWWGWLSMLPTHVEIWWNRTVAESCESCIDLAENNPYTLPGSGGNELPTAPQAGDTLCLTNCKCFLEAFSEGKFYGLKNRVSIEVTKIGSQTVRPDSPEAIAAAGLYQDLVEEYAWLTRMAQINPGHYRPLADIARREINSRAAIFGHTVRMGVNMSEILEPVTVATGAGWRGVDPQRWSEFLDDLVIGVAVGIIILSNSADRGVITAASREVPQITLDDERIYRLDEVGRAILFIQG